jgi:hypothetical protein
MISFIAGAALARFAASGGDKAARRAVFARHGVAEGVKGRCSGRVDFRADIRAGNRVDLVAEDAPGGQPLNIMPIERDEARVGELRRGTQLAGAERGRRTSDLSSSRIANLNRRAWITRWVNTTCMKHCHLAEIAG